MKMQLFVVAERKTTIASGDMPSWEIVFSSGDYSRAVELYHNMGDSKILVQWHFTKGTSILRAQFLNINLMDGMNNLDVSFDCLPGTERASLLTPVFNSVMRFLKE